MSGKRFTNIGGVEEFVHLVFDNENAKTLSVKQTVQKLNEQQATISALKEENRKLRNIHLSIDLTYSYGYGGYLADVRVIDDE